MTYIPPKYRRWLNDQATRRANIPYPTEAVVYERASNNPYWESRRQNALDHIPSSYSINFPVERVEKFLHAAAEFEQQKELDFLSKFYTGSTSNGESITDQFNILFQGRDIYNRVNERIKDILTNR